MRRLGLLLAVLTFVGAATLSTAGARVHATTTICHRTASKTTPYVRLRVSGKRSAWASQARCGHHPGPGRRLSQDGADAHVGRPRVPGRPDRRDGEPRRRSRRHRHGDGPLRAGQGQVCYQLAAKNLPAAAAAHIHRGDSGVAGPSSSPSLLRTQPVRRAAARPRRDRWSNRSWRSRVVLRQRAHGRVPRRRDPWAAHRHVDCFVWLDLRPRPEGHERAERDRHRGAPHPQGHGDGLLPAARRERHVADGRRAHPPGGPV